MPSYLTIEDVRLALMDRTPADNPLDMDLSFSDGEIAQAMTRAAREYNSIPPFVRSVTGARLPADDNVLLDATVEQLYIALAAKLRRNDIEYQAGGVSSAVDRARIVHLKDMIAEARARWEPRARERKLAANMAQAFRMYG